MRITVDTDRCVGAGQCVLSAPGVFDQDEDGLVTLRIPEPAPDEHERTRLAGTLCPSHAITVHQDRPPPPHSVPPTGKGPIP